MTKLTYRSKNRYREFLRAAKAISKKISKIPGVVGILATGGIGRGHCDYYSDLDLIIYADAKKVRELERYIAVGWLRYKGIELDTPVESYEKALRHKSPSRYWSQVMRWDRENSKILFDTDDRIRRLLKQKLVFPDWEQNRLLKKHSQGLTEHLIYGYELWAKRGRPFNIAHALIQAAEHLILWIYARNKRFQPYVPKWLFYHLENGVVPEACYLSTLKKPFTEPIRTRSEAAELRQGLLRLCDKLGVHLDFWTAEEVFQRDGLNWPKASEKTRYYLSW
jgi:hypothetical protein